MNDNLLKKVEEDIAKCDEVINSGDRAAARKLCESIVNDYTARIFQLRRGLTEFSYFEVTDYLKDVRILKRKLEIFMSELKSKAREESQSSERPREQVSETPQVKKPVPNFTRALQKTRDDVKNDGTILYHLIDQLLSRIDSIEKAYDSGKTREERWENLKEHVVWATNMDAGSAAKILYLIALALQ